MNNIFLNKENPNKDVIIFLMKVKEFIKTPFKNLDDWLIYILILYAFRVKKLIIIMNLYNYIIKKMLINKRNFVCY
jgi:hypothetical protein